MTINAPPGSSWRLSRTLPRTRNGLPAYAQAEVLQTGQDGLAERVRFTLDAGVIKDSYVLAYTWQGDEQYRAELVERGSAVSEMSGAYRLEQAGGATKVTYELAVGSRFR